MLGGSLVRLGGVWWVGGVAVAFVSAVGVMYVLGTRRVLCVVLC